SFHSCMSLRIGIASSRFAPFARTGWPVCMISERQPQLARSPRVLAHAVGASIGDRGILAHHVTALRAREWVWQRFIASQPFEVAEQIRNAVRQARRRRNRFRAARAFYDRKAKGRHWSPLPNEFCSS